MWDLARGRDSLHDDGEALAATEDWTFEKQCFQCGADDQLMSSLYPAMPIILPNKCCASSGLSTVVSMIMMSSSIQ